MRYLLQLATLLALAVCSTSASAMVRPVSRVEAAIRHAAPTLPAKLVKAYALAIQPEAAARDFDPYTVVAIVRNESRFHAGAVNEHRSGLYIGLGQHNLYHRQECDPRRGGALLSAACQARKAELLDGAFNLRQTARAITANRQACRRITGKPALFARWLSSYQGFNDHAASGRSGVWCNMRKDGRGRWQDVQAPKLTRRVMSYRRLLVREIG